MFITPDTNYEDKEASKWKNLSDVTHVYFQNRKKKNSHLKVKAVNELIEGMEL